jgi:hypothetical protein
VLFRSVPLVDESGSEFGVIYRRAETASEIQAISEELATLGCMMTRKVFIHDTAMGAQVTYLDEYIYSFITEDDEVTEPHIRLEEK